MTLDLLHPPKDAPMAEQAVIGAALFGRSHALRARLAVSAEDFWSEVNQTIFKAVCELLDSGMDVDMVTLAERLRFSGKLGDIGGVEYLNKCHNALASTDNLGHYAQLVRYCALDRRIKRQVIVTAQETTPEQVAVLGDLIFAQRGLSVSGFLDFKTDITETLDAHLADRDRGIDTGFSGVDEVLCGLQKGDILTVGARTGCGKTAVSTKIMLNIAHAEVPCCYITTEMSKAEMLCRVLPIASGVPARKFNRKDLSYEDIKRVNAAVADDLSRLPIKIWAHPSPKIADIQAAIIQSKCRVAFVDYLQRCSFPELRRQDARTYQIADFMLRLKTFCADSGVSVVLGCQLTRKRDKEKGDPTLSDLSDSGAVENESVKVALLCKREKGPPASEGGVGLKWIMAKNRKGKIHHGEDQFASLELRSDFVDIISTDYELPNLIEDSEPEAQEG